MIWINGYPIDVAITEGHTFNNVVTSNPVEKGVSTTDHSRSDPILLAYEGIVSDSPLGRVRAVRVDAGVSHSTDAYDKLTDVRDGHKAVTIEDSMGVWTDYLLTSLTIPRSKEAPDTALRFTVTFIEARFVTNERKFVRVATASAGKKRNLGTKPTDKEKKPGAKQPYESWATQLGIGRALGL